VNGPYPCGRWSDIKIFRDRMKLDLSRNERVEADNGYKGEDPESCKTPGGFCAGIEKNHEERMRIRARHESVNGRMKNFKILQESYRHNLSNHGNVFRSIAVLVQLSIENGESLFGLDE